MKFKSLLIAALAAATLNSCSKSNEDIPGPDAGKNTYATITLSYAKSNATRAHYGSTTVTDAEKKINNVILYIVDANTDVVEFVVPFTNGETTKTFEATTGPKKFISIANFGTAGMVTAGASLETLQTYINGASDIATVATDNNFWMTTTDIVPATIVLATKEEAQAPGHSNHVVLPMGRAMAKVGVYYNAPSVSGGVLQNVGYKIRNNPSALYLFGGKDGDNILRTPYYADRSVTGTYFDNSATYLATTLTSGEHTAPSYMMENSNQIPKSGNATYVQVKGEFVPSAWKDKDGNDITAPSSASSFWRVANVTFKTDKDGNKTQEVDKIVSWEAGLYNEKPSALVMDADTQAAYEYDGGVCYYALYLKHDDPSLASADQYSVYRNQYWSVEITSVSGLGYPNEEDPGDGSGPQGPDPEQPVDPETQLDATIKVLDWTGVEMNGGLEGSN